MKNTDKSDARLHVHRMKPFLLLFLVLIVFSGCTNPTSITRTYLDGAFPSTPLPFVGDSLPAVVISPWATFGSSRDLVVRTFYEQSLNDHSTISWKNPPLDLGATVIVTPLSRISVVLGAQYSSTGSDESTRFFLGTTLRQKFSFINLSEDVGFSRLRMYSSYQLINKKGVIYEEGSGIKTTYGMYVAATLWMGEKLAPMLQFAVSDAWVRFTW